MKSIILAGMLYASSIQSIPISQQQDAETATKVVHEAATVTGVILACGRYYYNRYSVDTNALADFTYAVAEAASPILSVPVDDIADAMSNASIKISDSLANEPELRNVCDKMSTTSPYNIFISFKRMS